MQNQAVHNALVTIGHDRASVGNYKVIPLFTCQTYHRRLRRLLLQLPLLASFLTP
jgi:hypothetical protein